MVRWISLGQGFLDALGECAVGQPQQQRRLGRIEMRVVLRCNPLCGHDLQAIKCFAVDRSQSCLKLMG